jgi:uncharacterized protein (DUF58 family)
MRPGPRLPAAFAVLAVLALAVPFDPRVIWVVTGLLGALLAAALTEAMVLRGVRLDAERPESAALGLATTDVFAARVFARTPVPLRLHLRQVAPSLLSPASVEQMGTLRPSEALGASFTFRAEARGRATLPALHAGATAWGLVERLTSIGSPVTVDVVPDLKSIARVRARLDHWATRGFGARLSPRLGKGREFERLRDYVPGDDRRDIAWKVSARRGKPVVREYRVERTQHILICLDRGHRMGARVSGVTKLDHAVTAALVLAFVADRMEDVVAGVSFAQEVENGPGFARGGAQLRRLTAFVSRVMVTRAHSDYTALAAAVRARARQRTLVVLFTALAETEHGDLLASVRLLMPQHLVLVVALSDPALAAAAERLPETEPALFETLAAKDLVAARRRAVLELRRLGALVTETSAPEADIAAMNAYLDVKRRQIL